MNLSFITENLAFSQTFGLWTKRMDILRKYNLWTEEIYIFIDEITAHRRMGKSRSILIRGTIPRSTSSLSAAPTHGCCPVSLPRYFRAIRPISVYPFSYQEYTEIRHLEQNRESLYGLWIRAGLRNFCLAEKSRRCSWQLLVCRLKDTILLRTSSNATAYVTPGCLRDLFAFLVAMPQFSVHRQHREHFKSQGRRRAMMPWLLTQAISKTRSWRIVVNALTCAEREILSGTAKYYINDLVFKNFLYPGNSLLVWVINWRILSSGVASGRAMMSIPDVPKKKRWTSSLGKVTVRYICNPPTCW